MLSLRPSWLLALGLLLATPATAHAADWSEGRIAEGDNAYTMRGGHLRLSLLGRSAVGLTDRLELSGYLPLYLALFPNLALKYRLVDTEALSLAFKAGAGGGIYPFAIALGPAAVAGVVGLATERLEVIASTTIERTVSFSARAGLVYSQVGGVVAGAGQGVGGVKSGSASRRALVLGAEVDVRLTDNDALVVDAEYYRAREGETLVMPPIGERIAVVGFAGSSHAFGPRLHATGGLYAIHTPGNRPWYINYPIVVVPHLNAFFVF